VYARRLERSSLAVRAPRERLLEVASAICGAHAQLTTGAELALSARVEDITRDDVRAMLWDRRELVKANTLRTTLHLHPAGELALWRSVRLGDRRWRLQWWLDQQQLTIEEAEKLRTEVLDVLDDGEPRTRREIGNAIGGELGARLAGDSWGHFLAPAGDLLCYGPPRGRSITVVRCDRWVPGFELIDAADAQREASRRYYATYGPARRAELEHWLALKLDDETWESLDLEEVDVEGHKAFVTAGDDFPDAKPSGVRLLSHYDVYTIGCHPRDHLIAEQKERVFLRGAGPNPVVLVDGRVAGVWQRTRRGRRMELRVEPFRALTKAQKTELADDAARVARTLGAEPLLELA
jgi:hypothetical protein